MKLRLSEDKKYFTIIKIDDKNEYRQLNMLLAKKIKDAKYNPTVKKGFWDGVIHFLDKQNRIPSGLWKYVQDNMKSFGFDVEFEGLSELFDNDITLESFNLFIDELLKDNEKLIKRDHQVIAAFNILKYKLSSILMATNSGKTLVTYYVFQYLLKVKKKKNLLMVVPRADLVIQTTNEYYEYAGFNSSNRLRIQQIYSGAEKSLDNNVYIGTFQSLTRLQKDYFEKFDAILIDECHTAKSKSILNIYDKMSVKCEYKIGCSGTFFDDNTAEHLNVMKVTGPIVYEVRNSDMIADGVSTPVKISVIKMNYKDDKIKEGFCTLAKKLDAAELFRREKKFVTTYKERNDFIINVVCSTQKNSLLLFHLTEYGDYLYNEIIKRRNEKVYYIDGAVSTKERERIKQEYKNTESGVILIASYGTFSTGISINNIHNIFLAESFKSFIVILQTIGRGLRLHKDKKYLNFVDFVDDMSYTDSNGWKYINFLEKHHKERLKIYKSEGFEYIVKEVNI